MSAVVAPTIGSPSGARSASKKPSRTVASLLSRTRAPSRRSEAPAITPAPKPSLTPALTISTSAPPTPGRLPASARSSGRWAARTSRESSPEPLSTRIRRSPWRSWGAIERAARRVRGAFFQLTRTTRALRRVAPFCSPAPGVFVPALIGCPPAFRRGGRGRLLRLPTCSWWRGRGRPRLGGHARFRRRPPGRRRGHKRRWPARGDPRRCL